MAVIKRSFSEKEMEDAVVRNPEKFLGERGLKLTARQYRIGNYCFDLLFEDRHGGKLIVELQKGALDRNHTYKILDYFDEYKTKNPNEFLDLLVIANKIPRERRNRLSSMGISFKEIPESDLLDEMNNGVHSKEELQPAKRIKGQPLEGEKATGLSFLGAEKKADLFVEEKKYTLQEVLERGSPTVGFLFHKFHQEMKNLSDEVARQTNNPISARTHQRGLTYFATERKAFIFLNIQQNFLSLILYTGNQKIQGTEKCNWLQGGDNSGGKLRIEAEKDIELALKAARQAFFIRLGE